MSDELERGAGSGPETADDQRLQAFVDGELDAAARAAFEHRMARDPHLAARVDGFIQQKRLLATALAGATGDAADPYTATLADGLALRLHRTRFRWLRRFAMAAAFLAAGWWGHDLVRTVGNPVPDQVADAAEIHELFAEDKDHPVELSAAESGALADWMSREFGETVAVPNLSGVGLTYLGGRPFGREEGPFAQLVYEARDGSRVSLYLAREIEEADAAVQIVQVDDLNAGYWRQDELAYTIVTGLSDERLLTIASRLGADGAL